MKSEKHNAAEKMIDVMMKLDEFCNDFPEEFRPTFRFIIEATIVVEITLHLDGANLQISPTLDDIHDDLDGLVAELGGIMDRYLSRKKKKESPFVAIKNQTKPFLTPRQEVGLD